jgi:hypothetical protein
MLREFLGMDARDEGEALQPAKLAGRRDGFDGLRRLGDDRVIRSGLTYAVIVRSMA